MTLYTDHSHTSVISSLTNGLIIMNKGYDSSVTPLITSQILYVKYWLMRIILLLLLLNYGELLGLFKGISVYKHWAECWVCIPLTSPTLVLLMLGSQQGILAFNYGEEHF